ncbi:MAG: phosphate ABC transporter permease subunit PstC [Candidatus Aenigmarchaeota archaeon]|nr:phosphate ABC transporter permease subunit PstC [Candidatus Aenigmarchaeota archaeon]
MNKNVFEAGIKSSFFIAAVSSILIVLFIILFLFKEGYVSFENIGIINFLFGKEWIPTGYPPRFGALPLIVGTLLVTAGAAAISIPLGIGSAIFTSEIASYRVKRFLKPMIELLSGIPSVVYGFFGLIVLTDWIRIVFNRSTGESWLAGSILLGIMALPTIVTVVEDSISSVPKEYREASLALGANKWQTIKEVILPASLSGITAAIILGIGRAIGETMAVMMVTGNSAIIPSPITNIFSPIRTITGTLGIEMGEVGVGSIHYHALFGLAVILFVIVLSINMISHLLIKKNICIRNIMLNKNIKNTIHVILFVFILWILVSFFGIYGIIVFVIGVFYNLFGYKISAKIKQRAAFIIISLSVIVVLFVLCVILYYIVFNGMRAMSWEFLTQPLKDAGRAGGIYPAIIGTLYLVGGAIFVAMPLGVGASIYLSEYTKKSRIKSIIKAGIDSLNGTPSIVFGLFGFAFFVLYLKIGISLIAGQLILAFLILPTIIKTSEEALKNVPQTIREASLALGATKWQTIRKSVLPSAIPGVITGVILGMGRAAGETAPIMFAATVFSQRYIPSSIFQPVMALPYHLFVLATSIPGGTKNAYGTALVLLIIVMLLYGVATLIREHYRKKIRW